MTMATHAQPLAASTSSVSVLWPVSTEAGWVRARNGVCLTGSSLGHPHLIDLLQLIKRPLSQSPLQVASAPF